MSTDAEASRRRQLLALGDGPAAALPAGCVHELIGAQARRTPDAAAVISGTAQLTYGELDRWCNQVAHRLIAAGVGPGALVGVCLERSFELVVALVAIWKAGGAYVPLDAEYPRERLALMVSDADEPNPNKPTRSPGSTPATRKLRKPMIPAQSRGAACRSSRLGGRGKTKSARATAYSA